ncbi:guided entry of tail-anchored proteins factor 1-like [Penaeus indicus]|uniref:guided entry of tail-anchored proteins factor 1-like n=1 Tax=Penaeus indicus TaxID=29960 RepID=UPI00300C047A
MELTSEMYLFLITSILGSAGSLLPFLMQLILQTVGKESQAERLLRQEILKLKQQLQTISMVDQFASYAKVQRKINALSQQYKDKAMERSVGEQRVRMVLGGTLRTIVGLLCVWLIWEHRSDPVVSLPTNLVWPFGPILALPSCEVGQISVMIWLAVVRTVCNKVNTALTSPRTTPQRATPIFNPPPVSPTAVPVAPPLD